MAMAICHKSHMGGKTEEAGGFVLAQLELEFEYKWRQCQLFHPHTRTHTHSCKTKRQTLLISRVLLSLFRFICSTCQVQQTDDKRTKERTIEWRTNRQHATSTTLLPTPPRPGPHTTPISSCCCATFLCVFPGFFFLPIFRFPRMIDCCCPNIPSYLFCIWQIHAHPLAANV